MPIKKLSEKEGNVVAAMISNDLVGILRDSEDKRGLKREFVMMLGLAYESTGGDGKLVLRALAKAYRKTKNPLFEEVKREFTKQILLT